MKLFMTTILAFFSLASIASNKCMSSRKFYEQTQVGQSLMASARAEFELKVNESMKALGLDAYEMKITREDKAARVNLNGYGYSNIYLTAEKDGIKYKTRWFDRGSFDAFKPTGWKQTKRDDLGNIVSDSTVCFYQLVINAPSLLWNTSAKVSIPFEVQVYREFVSSK